MLEWHMIPMDILSMNGSLDTQRCRPSLTAQGAQHESASSPSLPAAETGLVCPAPLLLLRCSITSLPNLANARIVLTAYIGWSSSTWCIPCCLSAGGPRHRAVALGAHCGAGGQVPSCYGDTCAHWNSHDEPQRLAMQPFAGRLHCVEISIVVVNHPAGQTIS